MLIYWLFFCPCFLSFFLVVQNCMEVCKLFKQKWNLGTFLQMYYILKLFFKLAILYPKMCYRLLMVIIFCFCYYICCLYISSYLLTISLFIKRVRYFKNYICFVLLQEKEKEESIGRHWVTSDSWIIAKYWRKYRENSTFFTVNQWHHCKS